LKSLKRYFLDSYRADPKAFYLELTSFIFTVGASMWLAMHADAPDMTVIYPGFFIGSIAAVLAYHRRRLVWPLLLTAYFACVNIFGYGVATGWW
jgi:hypothetical protein